MFSIENCIKFTRNIIKHEELPLPDMAFFTHMYLTLSVDFYLILTYEIISFSLINGREDEFEMLS